MLRRTVLFGVKITVGFWLQERNLLEFPQARPGTGDLHRRKGRRDLAVASLLLVLVHEPDWISQSKTGSWGWQ